MTSEKVASATDKAGKRVVAPALSAPSGPSAAKAAPQTASPAATVPKAAAAPAPDSAPKPAAEKPAKPKKPKLVRDSFTIPKSEYTVLDDLKQRAVRLSSPAKKSELLRAGIKALAAMPDAAFLGALRAVPAIKTGRPPSKT